MLNAWQKHHGGHALIASGVAFPFLALGWAVWLGTFLGCIVFPFIHEGIEWWRGARSTQSMRDHVADIISYQPAWVVVLLAANAWAWAGALAAFLAVSYVATLRWAKPGPYFPEG